jgi:PPP family 3-phenylpropionic acid transporter
MDRDQTHRTPYWRLSAFYFFYFGALGALVPYWAVYLESLGFSAGEIGELMALFMATKVVAPNVWGWIADHVSTPLRLVQGASLAALLSFAGVFFVTGFWGLAAVMGAYSFFWNAALPQFEATTLNHLGARAHRYARVRLWGSIGFIVVVVVVGRLMDGLGTPALLWSLLVVFTGIWLTTLVVPERAAPHPHEGGASLLAVLRRREVVTLLLVVFLLQAAHGPYYTFYTLYLEDHGYAKSVIGPLWALGVVAEVVLFLGIHRLLGAIGPARLLLATCLLAGLRWLLIGHFPDHLVVLALAQLLHAATYGVFHASAIDLIHRLFRGRHQVRGQALYASVSFGAGGALGNLGSGYLWDGVGASVTYSAAAGLCALAFMVGVLGLREPRGL